MWRLIEKLNLYRVSCMLNQLKTIKIKGISNWNISTVSQTLAVIDLASRSTVSIVLDFVWLHRQNIANGIYSWALKGLQILQESVPVVCILPAWKPYVLQLQWPRPDIALGGSKWTSLNRSPVIATRCQFQGGSQVSCPDRVPTRTGKTGKPGKMGRHFPVREKSGNFEQTGKVREKSGKTTPNTGKLREFQKKIICYFSMIFKWTVYYLLKWIKFSVKKIKH